MRVREWWRRRRRRYRSTWAWCPTCSADLIGLGRYHGQWGGLAIYECAGCGLWSSWLFDAPVPILVDWDWEGEPFMVAQPGLRDAVEARDAIRRSVRTNIDVLNRLDTHLGCVICRGPLTTAGRCPICQEV